MHKKTGAIELDKARALLHALLLADFFGVNGRQQAGSALAGGALFQAGIASLAGALLYIGLPPFPLAVAGLTLVAVLTALLLGFEAGSVLRSSNDTIAGLPISLATVRAARAVHAILYIILGTSGAAIPIAVFVGSAAGSWSVGLLTYLAAIHQTIFFASLVAGGEALLGANRFTARLRPIFAFAIGAALVGTLLIGIRPLPELRDAIVNYPNILLCLPPAWFAAEATAAAAPVSINLLFLAAGSTAACAIFIMLSVVMKNRAATAASPAGPLRKIFKKLFVRSDEFVTYDFTLDLLPREGDRALRAAPIFAFPAGLLAVGAAISDPVERKLFVHVLLFVVNAFLPAAVLLLAKSRYASARWIFDTSPIVNESALRRGVFKASIVRIAIPLFVVLEAAETAVTGAAGALLHAPIVFIVMLWILDRSVQRLPSPFPFSEPLERLDGAAGEGAMTLAFILTIVGFVESWFVKDWPTALAVSAVLAAGFFIKYKKTIHASTDQGF